MPFGEDHEEAKNLRLPFVSNNAGSGNLFVVLCVLVVALGPIQFGFTVFTLSIIMPFHFLLLFYVFIIYFSFGFALPCWLYYSYSVVILLQHKLISFEILISQFQGYLAIRFDVWLLISKIFLIRLLICWISCWDSFRYLDLCLTLVQWWEQPSVVK